MAKPITRGGIPTAAYNTMKSRQAAQAQQKINLQRSVQSRNASNLSRAEAAYKSAPTKGAQNAISRQINRLKKNPSR